MSSLEIFPNLAVYRRVVEKDGLVPLPENLEDVSVFKKSGDQVVLSKIQLDNKSSFQFGKIVVVDGERGLLYAIGEKHVVLIQSENSGKFITKRIYKPKNISTEDQQTAGKTVEANVDDVISGFISGLSWKPTYVFILSQDVNKITNITLSAYVNASNLFPFTVDKIVFNTKSVLREQRTRGVHHMESAALMAAPSEAPSTVPMDLKVTYVWEKSVDIEGEISLPLDKFNDLEISRLYFLDLSEQSKATYGYMFDVTDFIPPGRAKIYNSDLEFVGFSTLLTFGKRILIEIAPEEKLLVQTVVETSRPEGSEESTRQVTEYEIKITSKFDQPITLVLKYSLYGKLLSADPEISERLPGMIIWYLTSEPGEHTFRGRITSQY